MVPYPYAAHDHQTYNANSIAKRGGGLVVTDEDCGSGKIIPVLTDLLNDDARREQIRKCAASQAIPDTDERIFRSIAEALGIQD